MLCVCVYVCVCMCVGVCILTSKQKTCTSGSHCGNKRTVIAPGRRITNHSSIHTGPTEVVEVDKNEFGLQTLIMI